MSRNRRESDDFRKLSAELGVPDNEIKKVLSSFFGVISAYSRTLPFDDHRKIYSRDAFAQYGCVFNIPYIGRIGPVYSRYLKWRRNESSAVSQEPRSRYGKRILQSEIETMAEDILSGRAPSPARKRKPTELYNRVWLVGKDGKKLARQVIPKENKDVQD